MSYDLNGRLTSTQYPDGTSANQTYDAEGKPLSRVDRAGHATTYASYAEPILLAQRSLSLVREIRLYEAYLEMPDFDALARDFYLEEATLESIHLGGEEDLYLILKIYEGNVTLSFEGDFKASFPEEKLIIKCGRYIFFDIDRLSPYGRVESQASHDRETSPQAREVRRTIIGWAFFESSDKLSRLGADPSAFRHLICEAVGLNIEVVFERLEILSSLPDLGTR